MQVRLIRQTELEVIERKLDAFGWHKNALHVIGHKSAIVEGKRFKSGEMDGEGDGQDVVVRATASKPAQDCKAAGYVVTGDPMILWKKEYIRSRAG